MGFERAGFQEIDTDGRGMADGQFEVNYQFVDWTAQWSTNGTYVSLFYSDF